MTTSPTGLSYLICALGFMSQAAVAAPHAASAARSPEPDVHQITWLMPDSKVAGPGPGRSLGYSDRLVAYLSERLPQIQQRSLVANSKRSWQLLARGEPVCIPAALRTPEREAVAYFIDAQWVPPPQLIVRRDRLERLPRNSAGEVDLARLLADTSLRGALFEGRSYGPHLDGLLKQAPNPSAVSLYAHAGAADKLLNMVLADRADYTLDYDFMLRLRAPDNEAIQRSAPGSLGGNGEAELLPLPVQGADEGMIGAMACPRNAWGLAALRQIDRVLGTPAGARFLREVVESLLTPDTRRHYSSKIDAFYRERARPSKPG
ncbi:MAG: hypothetical protein O9341_17315 [Paucibacter sp.]|nr:hypothetical protein [Roseateles sp.]